MKYNAKRYVFSGRYIVRNALTVMIISTIIALVLVVLNLPGKSKKTEAGFADPSGESVEAETIDKGSADYQAMNQNAVAQNGMQADRSAVQGVGGEVLANVDEAANVAQESGDPVLTLSQPSMIGDIETGTLAKVIEDERKTQVAAKDVQVLTNSKYDMTGKFLTENDAVNIRKEASSDAEGLGRLYIGGTGEVLEKGEEWTKICSDGITGYVSTKLILTDEAATEKAELYRATFAVVKAKVRVRAYGNGESEVYYIAREGEFFTVDRSKSTSEWTCVRMADGSFGFVSTSYVSITEGFAEAVSMEDIDDLKAAKIDYRNMIEEEKRQAEEERKAQEKAAREAEERAAKEEAEREAKEKEIQRASSETSVSSGKTTTRTVTVEASVSDVYLLAAIVYAEAGSECYDAQLAVANVVVNRLHSGSYPNNLADVIYQPYQFTACKTRTFANALSTGGSSQALRAAQEALAGVNNVGKCIGFKFPSAVNRSKVSYCVQYGSIMFFY